MMVQSTIYGFTRVRALGNSPVEIRCYYYANEDTRNDVLAQYIADYPEDGFYPFEFGKEVEVDTEENYIIN